MIKNIKKLVSITLILGSVSSVYAQGTLSGTQIDSTASLTFTVNGQQSDVTSTHSYVVDTKVDMSVDTTDAQAVTTAPGSTNVVLKYKVQNDGNKVQDFILNAKTVSTTAFTSPNDVTDSTDFANVRVFVDDGDGTFDPSKDTETFIDELNPDESKTVFIVADVPSDATNDQVAVYDLEAQVAESGTAGSAGNAITSDNSNQADDAATVQIVFADGAGSADAEHDGKFSSADAWKVVTANVTVEKNSIVVSDPVNGTTNPKRIPGAVIRYCYIVNNATGGADATGAVVTDTIDPNILDTTGQNVKMYSGTATCTCETPEAEIAVSNGANGQDPDAQGTVKIDFETVAGGSTECAYVSATIK